MSKENLFCSDIAIEIQIFNSWWHLVSVANQFQDSTFLFDNNSESIGTSKLVSQLKPLPSLFELKENDTIVMSTIIKKLQDKAEAP